MQPGMLVASAEHGVLFRNRFYANKDALLSALHASKCEIQSNPYQLLKQKVEAACLLNEARKIARCESLSLKHQDTVYESVLKANLLLHAEAECAEAIPLFENNMAYSDRHPLCVSSLYGCIFLVIRDPQSNLCLGMHLFRGMSGGVREHEIRDEIRQFISYVTVNEQPDYYHRLEAYLIGGSDLSIFLFQDIFNALSTFNITIEASHLTVGCREVEVHRPTYVSFNPVTLRFAQRFTDYDYSSTHFQHLVASDDFRFTGKTSLVLAAVCKNGRSNPDINVLDKMIYTAMLEGYQAFNSRYDAQDFISIVANLPEDIQVHTDLSRLFHQHRLSGMRTINDLARVMIVAVVYPRRYLQIAKMPFCGHAPSI